MESSEDIAQLVIEKLEKSSLLKKLVQDAVKEAFSDVVTRLEKQEGRIIELEGKVKAQEVEMKHRQEAEENYKEKLSVLEKKLDAMEQHSRSHNIRIQGVHETKEEDPEKVMIAVGRKMGINVTPSDFVRCHRLGPPPPTDSHRKVPRPLLVQFASLHTRAQVMGARAKLKGSKIFVNDDLTPTRQKLLFNVRHCPKVERSWSQEGRIFAGLKNSSGGYTKKLITCDADILKL